MNENQQVCGELFRPIKKYLNQKLWLSQHLLEDQDLVKNNEGYYLFFSKSFKIELAVKD